MMMMMLLHVKQDSKGLQKKHSNAASNEQMDMPTAALNALSTLERVGWVWNTILSS